MRQVVDVQGVEPNNVIHDIVTLPLFLLGVLLISTLNGAELVMEVMEIVH